jgi:hypothetical protein
MASLADRLREEAGNRTSLSDIFAEEPVDLSTFVQDKKFLDNPPLSPVQYDAIRHLEQVLYPDTYDLMVTEFGSYWTPVRYITEATFQWGKGGGKDHTCRVAVSRIMYLLLCLHSPQDYFGIPRQDSIHGLNVASSTGQATRAFFQPLKRALTRKGCWFEDKCSDKEQSIMFDKNLEAISGHSTADTQEGLNLIVGIADEISAFRTRDEANRYARGPREAGNTAENIMSMLRTSASTRFPDGNYKIASISFPRYKGDAIQQLTTEARADNEKYGEDSKRYVSGPLCTWDVNPRVKGREQFRHEYDKDPDAARAKYECDPPSSTNTFFRNKMALSAAFGDVRPQEPIMISYYWATNEHGKGAWFPKFHFAADFLPIEGAIYAMHGDIGITQDHAGVALAHVKKWDTREWLVGHTDEGQEITQEDRRPIVKLDFVSSFAADLGAKPVAREVQISWYRELLLQLERRGFVIKRYTFDGFQSTDSMQQLQARGIESERVSTDGTDAVHWKTLRDLLYEGRLEGYYRKEVYSELEQLTKLSNGKVDHPPFGSKDEADALCLACVGALTVGGAEDEDATPADMFGTSMPEAIGNDDHFTEDLSEMFYSTDGSPW